MCFVIDFEVIANEITSAAADLDQEVAKLAEEFTRTKYFNDPLNFRYAHYGYLMACMGQIDTMSLCVYGQQHDGGQTQRMRDFLDEFMYPGREEAHRVAVQLMRHTLMHTGWLRPVYDKRRRIAYTWQIFFTNALGQTDREHYTVSSENLESQQAVVKVAKKGRVKEVRAFNLHLDRFAADIDTAAQKCVAVMRDDERRRERCRKVFPSLLIQTIGEPRRREDRSQTKLQRMMSRVRALGRCS